MSSDERGPAASREPVASPLRRYFDVLACVARADGIYSERERAMVEAAATACELDASTIDALTALADPARTADAEGALRSAAADADVSLIAETLRDGFLLAAVDDDIAPAEHSVLEQFLVHAGYDDAGRAVLLQWARRASEHHLDGVRLAAELRAGAGARAGLRG